MSPKRALIFGTGAVGTIYAYLLNKAGVEVTTICRSNYTAAKTQGFHIDSEVYGQNLHFKPRVVRTPEEAVQDGTVYDYLLVACKAISPAETAQQIAPAVTKGKTTILLLQNGIDIEEPYHTQFPSNVLLTCVVYLPVTQTSPGHISMGYIERLEIGPYPTPTPPPSTSSTTDPDPASTDLISLLKSAGGNPVWHGPHIQERRWYKLILNAPWNPICALTLSDDITFLSSSPPEISESVIQGVVSEIIAIAATLGYESVNEAASLESRDRVKTRLPGGETGDRGGKGIQPSMLVDVLQKRKTEHEVILGNPVRKARELGVSVPRLELLYALVRGLDGALQREVEAKGGEGRKGLNGEELGEMYKDIQH